MALIPISERVEPTGPVYEVPGYGGTPRPLAYPVNEIVEEIQDAAYAAGFDDPNLFKIFSGYRSDARQQAIFDRKVAKLQAENPSMSLSEIHRIARKTVAKPGRSSHRTGFAFDVYLGHKPGFSIANASRENTAYIETTPAYAFMRDIAPEYGLTQLPNEPWHWECDQYCRDSFLARNSVSQNFENRTSAASTSKKIGIALLAISGVTALSLGGWIIYNKRKRQ